MEISIWKLNSILLSNKKATKRAHFEWNQNEETTYQNVRDTGKAGITEKCIHVLEKRSLKSIEANN